MAESAKTGWVKDNNGNKIAPKTFTSQVMTSDGTSLDDVISELHKESSSGSSTSNTAGIVVGTCDTDAATAAKVVTVDSDFELKIGTMIAVKFTNANTASSPTINVNDSGAKSVLYNGSTTADMCGTSGHYAYYVYDGTYWVWVGRDVDNSTDFTGGDVTSNTRQKGGTTDYTAYKFRNIGFGTSDTPTSDSTYGGNGSIYFKYS